MSCHRLIFTIIYSSISGIAYNCHAAPQLIAKVAPVAKSHISYEFNQNTSKHFASDVDITNPSELSSPQTVYLAQTDASVSDQDRFNRRWSLLGMIITSSISVILLAVLFQKPSNSPKISKKSQDSASTKTDTNSSSLESKLNAIFEETNPQEAKLVSRSQVNKPVHNSSALGIDIIGELIQDLQQDARVSSVPNNFSDQTNSGNNLRRKAIWELAKIGDYRALEALISTLPKANAVDKNLIFHAIAKIINRNFGPIHQRIFISLQDENPKVRKNAICELTALYKFVAPITKKLRLMQTDTDYEVRQTAFRALKQLNLTLDKNSEDNSIPTINRVSQAHQGELAPNLEADLLAELNSEHNN